ncbi:hypothetical protein [Kordia sp.]|uniref:hypothetical protein n=1 Tax=Kordia sp. TaxID=1965332 RepID=UPI003B5B6DBC
MKKNISNLGTVLSKEQQREINGGTEASLTNRQAYCASLSIVYYSLTNDPEGDGISAENDRLAQETLQQWYKECEGVN